MSNKHTQDCAYAGLPYNKRPNLPWPAAPGEDMCACLGTEPSFPIADYLRDNCDVEFEYIELGGMRKHGDPPRYFIADQRMYEHQDEPWVCIFDFTQSPASLLRNLIWVNRPQVHPEVAHIWVFEARNKGQVASWLRDQGFNPDYLRTKPTPYTEESRITVNARERRIRTAEAAIARAQAEIDRMLSLPPEPTTDDPDGALVIWFKKKFPPGGRKYTYAVVKAGDGLWYTTGPQSPKGYTWDDLIEWIGEGTEIWIAGGWEPLA